MNVLAPAVRLLDLAPVSEEFLSEVLAGLTDTPRTLPCKYFYDERGSDLFQQICGLPEYYVTRTETEILRRHGGEIAASVGANAELVGFGTGAGVKTRMLLEQLENPIAYIPVDISKERLTDSANALSRALPLLEVLPVCADYLQPVELPKASRPADHVAVFFPGSTIGNFEPALARDFLRRICQLCGKNGGLIIGVDLQKPREVLEAAYNDRAGVTAEFNLNLLVRLNRELGADFDLPLWRHRAIYNEPFGRIEMHLVSSAEQTVHLGGRAFHFARDEKIVTEFSHKYTRENFAALAAAAGFHLANTWTDPQQLFAVFHFTVAE